MRRLPGVISLLMDSPATAIGMDLSVKIARLVEERGWNQEDLARIAGINRHTVREILKHGEGRRLRNDTVKKCAEALGLVVAELREWPLDKLLPRHAGETCWNWIP